MSQQVKTSDRLGQQIVHFDSSYNGILWLVIQRLMKTIHCNTFMFSTNTSVFYISVLLELAGRVGTFSPLSVSLSFTLSCYRIQHFIS